MKNIRLLAISNFWAYLVHLGFVYLTRMKMINNADTAEVSNHHPTLFTPAPITFFIWALIYLLLLIFCIYHLIAAFKYPDTHSANENTYKISELFILCNLTTAAWLYCWTHGGLGVSLGLIVFQLVLLMTINLRLHIYQRNASIASKICTQLPMSIWLAWICIATIANANIYLAAIRWSFMGLTPVQWTEALIGIAVLVGLGFVLGRRNIFFGLVVLWALYGIIVERTKGGTADHPEIVLAAEGGFVLIAIICLIQLIRNISFRRNRLRAHYPVFPEATGSLK
jgi:hypothetical protein